MRFDDAFRGELSDVPPEKRDKMAAMFLTDHYPAYVVEIMEILHSGETPEHAVTIFAESLEADELPNNPLLLDAVI